MRDGLLYFTLAPPAGFEPAANRLTVDCSTAELQGNVHSVECTQILSKNPDKSNRLYVVSLAYFSYSDTLSI